MHTVHFHRGLAVFCGFELSQPDRSAAASASACHLRNACGVDATVTASPHLRNTCGMPLGATDINRWSHQRRRAKARASWRPRTLSDGPLGYGYKAEGLTACRRCLVSLIVSLCRFNCFWCSRNCQKCCRKGCKNSGPTLEEGSSSSFTRSESFQVS
ncbi:hypothetical protein OG21DRAFT_1512213 [Imleria badia]|nr:hypothetical protein OG21DRAFT_1512213 [Imleria badia]